MVTQKIFHLHHPLAEARAHLCDLEKWGLTAGDLRVICDPAGAISRFEFDLPSGRRMTAEIEEVPGNDPARILFRSAGGDFVVAGMVELFGIRPNLTEVVVMLDYEPVSLAHRGYEALERLVTGLLQRIEAACTPLQAGAQGAEAFPI